ncbi:MAG: hypothetical protein HY884_10275 [Deltaproteobacteria bacterium]|nr:hypothetical protein [Deltaproteobacteria bacterium]
MREKLLQSSKGEKKITRFAQNAGLLAVLFFTLAGCMQVWHPGSVPDLSLDKVGALSGGYSVALVNDQREMRPQPVIGNAHVNYNEWTEFFINYYANELRKRGVNVDPGSPNKILVKLDGFTVQQGFAKMRANIHFRFSTSDGRIIKEMYETDTSGMSAGRAFAGVIYHTAEKLLTDREVLDRMKGY